MGKYFLFIFSLSTTLYGQGDGPSQTCFTLTKRGSLLSPAPDMPKPGPYYTTLVSMHDVERFPYEYALYFSTDHGERGGIWLYVCNGNPTERGNWKSYDQAVAAGDFDFLEKKPLANPIFVDRTQGTQTETPHANVIDGTVYMTYHNSGAGRRQSTLLATSGDGVNFGRINGDEDSVILDYNDESDPGDGHTGYFRWGPNPFPGVDYKYAGYSLHGGGDRFYSAMWASNDIRKWDRLQILTPIEGHAVDLPDGLIIWHEIDPNSITSLGNGEYVALCVVGTRASGSHARRHELYEIFLGGDGRTLTRQSRRILANGPAGSKDEEEVTEPTLLRIGDTLHLIYVGVRGRGGENTVMVAAGRFDRNASLSRRLEISEQQRHFYRK